MDCTINYAVTFCAVERFSTMWLNTTKWKFQRIVLCSLGRLP